VLVVSALASVDERSGLKAGGDDYLIKPFDMGELAPHRALLRRSNDSRASVLQVGHSDRSDRTQPCVANAFSICCRPSSNFWNISCAVRQVITRTMFLEDVGIIAICRTRIWSTSTSANCGISRYGGDTPLIRSVRAPALCSMWAIELFRSATFRLAILFALAYRFDRDCFAFIYWQVATFDVERLNAILVGSRKAVTQPEDRLEREIELRFTLICAVSIMRRCSTKVETPIRNVVAIPEGLPIDGKSHTVEMRKLRGDDAELNRGLLQARDRMAVSYCLPESL